MALNGNVDSLDRRTVCGWARDMDALDQPVRVRLKVDGHIVDQNTADIFRADLKSAGIGEGCFGFELHLPSTLETTSDYQLDVEGDDGAPLQNGHCTLWAERLQDEKAPTPSFNDLVGHQELRFDEIGDEFFEELYITLNTDVTESLQAGDVASAYEHWIKIGSKRGGALDGLKHNLNFTNPAQSLLDLRSDPNSPSSGFDAFSYFYTNPDVRRHTDGRSSSALAHWLENGRAEGRIAPGVYHRDFRVVDLEALSSRPIGINIFGPLATASGLGTAARAMAKAVKVSGLEFNLNTFDFSSGELRPHIDRTSKPPVYCINLLVANADLVNRVFASYPHGYFDNAYNIAVWQWELASPRADAYFAFEGLDEIWTNSRFQADAIRAISPIPVSRIHLPVAPPIKAVAPSRAEFGIPEGAFVFYMPFDVGSTSARKNPFAVIAAFRRLQLLRPNIHLVLKYHSGRFETGFMERLLLAVSGSRSITVSSTKLSLMELDRLRASCDCLVSAHRSEGFGLNIAEFLSLGKPVVATLYSGNLDFFDESVGFPVDFTLVELSEQVGSYHPGFVWAEPSTESLFHQMLHVVDSPDEVLRRGLAAKVRIAKLLNLETIGAAIAKRVSELEFGVSLPAFARGVCRGDRAIKQAGALAARNRASLKEPLAEQPLLSVVIPVYNVPPEYLRACLSSVFAQSYPYWELCICDDCSTSEATIRVLEEVRGSSPAIKIIRSSVNGGIAAATNNAVHIATGDFIVFLDNDDLLEPTALEEVARAASGNPTVDVIYSDEIKIDADGKQIDHFYKPDWSPEHLESVMYVLHLFVVRKRLILELGGLRTEFTGAQDYDLMLRCSRSTTRIHHIRKSLYRWRAIPGSAAATVDAKPTALQNGMRALADHATQKYGPLATVEAGLLQGTFRLRRGLGAEPPVTLIILTGNVHLDLPGRGNISLVENLIRSIVEKTDYRNFKMLVVDNSTLTVDQVSGFRQMDVQVINHVARNGFNYAEKANFAVRMATTENIVLLNDDMEVIRPDWLTALMELSTDPGIGAVGARLLHLDGSIQHVGTVLGVNDSAAHVYHSFPRDFVGYNGYTHIIRNYSAVTAACLATRRSVMAQVGWFDEMLAIDYNDIDFCLKVTQAGYRIAYTPYAELYHFESVSARRTVQNPQEVSRFFARWRELVDNDPFYNPNLTRSALDFSER